MAPDEIPLRKKFNMPKVESQRWCGSSRHL